MIHNIESLDLGYLDEKSKLVIMNTLNDLNKAIIEAEVELLKTDIEIYEMTLDK